MTRGARDYFNCRCVADIGALAMNHGAFAIRSGVSDACARALAEEEVIVARDNRPLLKLVPIESLSAKRRPGSARDLVKLSADFDATPADFGDYTR